MGFNVPQKAQNVKREFVLNEYEEKNSHPLTSCHFVSPVLLMHCINLSQQNLHLLNAALKTNAGSDHMQNLQ